MPMGYKGNLCSSLAVRLSSRMSGRDRPVDPGHFSSFSPGDWRWHWHSTFASGLARAAPLLELSGRVMQFRMPGLWRHLACEVGASVIALPPSAARTWDKAISPADPCCYSSPTAIDFLPRLPRLVHSPTSITGNLYGSYTSPGTDPPYSASRFHHCLPTASAALSTLESTQAASAPNADRARRPRAGARPPSSGATLRATTLPRRSGYSHS